MGSVTQTPWVIFIMVNVLLFFSGHLPDMAARLIATDLLPTAPTTDEPTQSA